MKVKLTEQQFRRIILKEDWPGMDIFDSGLGGGVKHCPTKG